ncbi:MAG: tRNA (adenine-N1)-methyltransferase [Candidatus Aenigmatarchaeota archaeon]
MKKGTLVLLVRNDRSYLVEAGKGQLNLKEGNIDLLQLTKKKFGDEIKTHIGKKLSIVEPNMNDILEKKVRRLPQIITPKDVALIMAYTGVGQGDRVVDAGTGSGFLSIILASHIKPGKVFTYEKNRQFFKVAKKNMKLAGVEKFVKIRMKDVTRGFEERNVDLVTLDLKNPEKIIPHAYKSLKPGGWLVVYSPYVEQVSKVVREIKRKDFSSIKIVENIVREWQVEEFTRPKTIGLMHTGFLTFARKMG